FNQIYQNSAINGYVCRKITSKNKDYSPVYSEDMKNKFSDTENLSAEAAEAITVLSNNRIINGTGDGLFAPYDNMTRAQAAVIIHNAIK
ncbi:MAG: S-layer homology domain-containing protein, partial [Clostridia bacterium]|nr:S-layer homology domain-containing protein [Clostridia bacterium]